MKTLYICGDSFCTCDPEYGKSWVERLIERCNNINIINLSTVGASNYLIHLQVKHALEQNCDFLIYHATSSIRNEFSITSNFDKIDNKDRYWSPNDIVGKSMLSNTWLTPLRNNNQLFSSDDLYIIKQFFTKFVDMPSQIMKNYIFISYTLEQIKKSNVRKWAWSRGGFEHKNFKNSQNWDFSQFQKNESNINLWDEYDPKLWRPYYHITDEQLLQRTCDYYFDLLNLSDV